MTANVEGAFGLKSMRGKRIAAVVAVLVLGGALAGFVFSAGGAIRGDSLGEGALALGLRAATGHARRCGGATSRRRSSDAFKLDKAGIAALLKSAPAANAGRPESMLKNGVVVSLPDPKGGFQRFLVAQVGHHGAGARAQASRTSPPSAGEGIDDPKATIHADLSPLGFHASVRSPKGDWYIDPYYHLDQSVYASYYGHDMPAAREQGTAAFVERDAARRRALDRQGLLPRGRRRDDQRQRLPGRDVAHDHHLRSRERLRRSHDEREDRRTPATSRRPSPPIPTGNLETHIVEASDPGGDNTASTSYQVVRSDDPTSDPPTGDVLRTYKLALITDPSYADYSGFANGANPGAVTAAKVTLINRVSQVYEQDMSIKLQLIAQTDLLNLNTWAQAIGPNGPCGLAGCFTLANVTGCSALARNRIVAGQIVGSGNFDIGHLALGAPGGGVANLGVVGRAAKAQGCTGIPTPTGDFYAIDYVAHEMGHQFSGNHPFNGTQLNCSGGNRNAAHLGRARLGLVDHGVRRHLPHRRPPGPLRPVLLGAQPAGDHDLHVVEPGGDQRGPGGRAAALRRRQRGSGRDVRAELRADGDDPAADGRHRGCPECHASSVASRRTGTS